MKFYPAAHIAFFGVFPDKDISEHLREGLLGTNAKEHEREIARRDAGDLQRILDGGEVNEDENEQKIVSDAANLRMRAAYAFAARENWIKPIKGEVHLGPTVSYGPELEFDIENSIMSTFYDYIRGVSEPTFRLVAPGQDTQPVAMMAHIRAVISGEVTTFCPLSPRQAVFKSVAAISSEPELDEAWFDFTTIDTVAHCKAHSVLRLSPLMGHGGFRPKPPGRNPV